MATRRMTLEEAKSVGRVDRALLDATTEADIERHMVEDGEAAEAEPQHAPPVTAREARRRLAMTQRQFAAFLHVPLATVRNWEQDRFAIDPAVRALLRIVTREPEAATRALGR